MLSTTASNRNPRLTAEASADDAARVRPWVTALLDGEFRDGPDGRGRPHAYKKWGGAHWRLVSLAELGVTMATPGAPPALREAWGQVTDWLLGASHLGNVPLI